jgi:hypothetical protein
MQIACSLRRATAALLPFATGLLTLACGSPEPSSAETHVSFPEGHHFYVLDVATLLRDDANCLGMSGALNLRLGLDLDVKGDTAEGWGALTSVNLGGRTALDFSPSSASVAGIKEGDGSVSFDALKFPVAIDTLSFDALVLTAKADGTLEGTATGKYDMTGSFPQCMRDFTATLQGVPDRTPPDVRRPDSKPKQHMPFEPIYIEVDEPVAIGKTTLEVRAGDAAVPAKLLFGATSRPGFADWLYIEPVTSFPGGASVSITLRSLTDAAGNSRDAEIGPLDMAPEGNAIDNLGFEQGLTGWTGEPQESPVFGEVSIVDTRSSYPAREVNGDLVDVKAVEGNLFAVVEASRLVGHLVPPAGKTQLRLSAALVHTPVAELPQMNTGMYIAIYVGGEPVVQGDAQALMPLANPMAGWTGWGPITLDLPKEASSGFWIEVMPVSTSAFSSTTTVLLDDISFQ